MNKHYLLGLAFALLCLFTYAQDRLHPRTVPCFTDELIGRQFEENPDLENRRNEMDRTVADFIYTKNKGHSGNLKNLNNEILIPVVVTVVHQNGPENITDLQVISQIDALNNYYAPYGIRFCLATKKGGTPLTSISTPSGITSTTPGIFHYYNPALTNHNVTQLSSLAAVSSALPSEKYLRIWVVKSITDNSLPAGSQIQGYSSLPWSVGSSSDGIVMDYRAFGDIATCSCSTLNTYSQLGRILVHETGHYMGLYHTFEGGCAGMSSSNCSTSGDRVCDTPPVAAGGNTGCPAPGWNTCNESPDLPDDIHNYMDYVDETCMTGFTPGQHNRMLAHLDLYRAVMSSAANIVYTGINCNNEVMAYFTASSYLSCTGSSIAFSANPVSGATYSWTFGDGATGSGANVSHTYTSVYTPAVVTLTVSDGSNTSTYSAHVYTDNCSGVSGTQSTWIFGSEAGLNFTSGIPVYDNSADVNNTMTGNIENVTSYCDASGNLLFYSNANTIWNNAHSAITTTMGGDNSSAKGSVVIPHPTIANRYYLFHSSLAGGLLYSEINAAGLSASVLSNGNTVPVPSGFVQQNSTLWSGEAITAIPACGNDFWLIAHGKKSEYQQYMLVYKVSSAGITFHSSFRIPGLNNQYCTIEASPDGTKVALSEFTGNEVFLCNFVPSSGHFTGSVSLPQNRVYGMSFSSDSRLLYTAQESTGKIHQYDTYASSVSASQIEVGTLLATGATRRFGVQMGPDNRIYLNRGVTQMAVIHQPDVLCTISQPNLCLFENNGPMLDAQPAGAGLPNIVDAVPAAIFTADSLYAVALRCDTYVFSFNGCSGNFSWNFGDPASGTNNTSALAVPQHVFSGPGTYTVTLIINGQTYTQTVVVASDCEPCVCAIDASFNSLADGCKVKFALASPVNPCLQEVTYLWDFGNGNTSADPSPEFDFGSTGSHDVCLTVTASDGTQTCTDIVCKKITTECSNCDCKLEPAFSYYLDEKTCTYYFKGEHGGPACLLNVEYHWDFGDGTTSMGQNPGHIYTSTGSYDVCLEVVVLDEKGKVLCREKHCKKIEVECKGECECKLAPYFDFVAIESCHLFFTGYSGSDCANITAMDWYVNGSGPYSTQHLDQQFTVNTTYEICLIVKANNGKDECEERYCRSFFYTDCYPSGGGKSFGENNGNTSLSLFPNPANNSFTVSLEGNEGLPVVVNITTPDGKSSGRFEFAHPENMQIIVPEGMASGILFVEVISGSFRSTERLMIQR